MARRIALLLLILIASWTAGAAATAQQARPREASDLLLRAGGAAFVNRDERVGTLVVLGNNAVVDGTVREQLIVIGGRASVSGEVEGDVVIVDGALDLSPSARVGGDVTLVRADLAQAPGAAIAGTVTRTRGMALGWGAAWAFWLSASVFVIACGLLFAALAGRQLAGAAGVLLARPGGSALTAVVVWIAVPVLAVVAFITVIGIPLGLALLIVVLPALWFLGYLIAGAGLGALLTRARRTIGSADRPYAAVALGLLLLQLIGFAPWIGGFVVFLAGLWGAGALSLRSWRVLRREAPLGTAAA